MRVVELGVYWAGPLLGQFLVQQGGQVTSVARPADARGASDERRAVPEALHAGKERLEARLPEDAARVLDCVRTADVVVENFGPGVARRLGVDFCACMRVNPRILYVHLPGFATTDDTFRHVKAWEGAILATSGVLLRASLDRTLLGRDAHVTHLPLASVYGAIFGLFAVLAARHGARGGEYIEVPLGSATSEALVHNTISFPLDDKYMDERRRAVERGDPPVTPHALMRMKDPFFATYPCEDGRHVHLVCPSHAAHQTRALRVLGVETEFVPATVDPYAHDAPRGIGSGSLSADQAALLRPRMQRAFLTRPAHEWERAFGAARVPAKRVATVREWTASDDARHSGLFVADRPAPLFWHEASLAATCRRTPPGRGEHLLSGVRVVDMTNVIAGPTAGSMLARAGADVIKVDPPRPSYSPEVAVAYGVAANVGKRSVLLDAVRGRDALDALLATADVLLVNCTASALRRIGLHADQLAPSHPHLIVARFDAWGGPSGEGALAEHNGYDDNVQAGIGFMARAGGGIETPEEFLHVGTIDVIAGVAFAASVVDALLRRREGQLRHPRTSLAAVGQYIQYPHLFDDEGAAPPQRVARGADGEWAWTRGDGAPPVRVRTFAEVARDGVRPGCCKGTFLFDVHHAHPMGSVRMVRPCAMRMNGLRRDLPPAPKYGAHTVEVLGEVAVRHLLLRGAASCAWSARYIPRARECDRCAERGTLVMLNCEHRLCRTCLVGEKCAVCGRWHETDVAVLRERRRQHVCDYGAWRRGASRGARDAHRMFDPGALARRAASMPDIAAGWRS